MNRKNTLLTIAKSQKTIIETTNKNHLDKCFHKQLSLVVKQQNQHQHQQQQSTATTTAKATAITKAEAEAEADARKEEKTLNQATCRAKVYLLRSLRFIFSFLENFFFSFLTI